MLLGTTTMILARHDRRVHVLAFLCLGVISAVAQEPAAAPGNAITVELERLAPAELARFAAEQREGVRIVQGNPLLVPQYNAARAALERAIAVGRNVPLEANLLLAKMLLAGEGGQVDFDGAIELLTKAFKGGEVEAGRILGTELLKLASREAEGEDALVLAFRLGDAASGLELANYYRITDPEQSTRLEKLALGMLEARLVQQDADAAFELAEYYRRSGPTQDAAKSLELYTAAYQGGNERALYWMASIRAQSGSLEDGTEAVRLYDLAAQRGSVEAARALTLAYSTGELAVDSALNTLWLDRLVEVGDVVGELLLANQVSISPQDRSVAASKLFDDLMAAAAPSIADLLELGSKFRDGDGVSADANRALLLFQRALERRSNDGVLRYGELILADPSLQTPVNLRRAFDNLERVASSGSISGAVLLGDYYVQGLGIRSDPEEALKWYEKAVQGGNSISAMSRIAEQYLASSDPEMRRKALPWWVKAAKAGSITAQVTIANAYVDSDWLPFDPLQAIYWYQQAINIGDVSSLDALAALHLRVGGVAGMAMAREVFTDAIDDGLAGASIRYASFLVANGQAEEAVSWLEESDEKLTLSGALLLHRLYSTGEAGRKDPTTAKKYLEIATTAVAVTPAERLALAGALLASDNPEDQAKAVPMLEDILAQHVPGAARLLADAYIKGQGTAMAVEAGLDIYNRAIKGGDTNAAVGLAELYAEGVYLPADAFKARSLFEGVLKNVPGDSGANAGLAELYSNDALGKTDLRKAAQYFLAAAKAGSNSAKLALGEMYMWGSGVDRDAMQSANWLIDANRGGVLAATKSLAALDSSVIARPASATQAFAYTLSAAKRGDIEAMRNVGAALLAGFGTRLDRQAGIEWLERAAAGNSGDAMYDLFRVYDEGTAGPVDAKLAGEWLQKAAESGNGSALYRTALASVQPDGSLTDTDAIELLVQAAHQNHNQSKKMLVRLGLLSASGAEAGFDEE